MKKRGRLCPRPTLAKSRIGLCRQGGWTVKRKAVVVLLVLALLCACSLLTACGDDPGAGRETEKDMRAGEPAPGKELMATADTQAEAERIAELYGVELVSWSGHLAVFHTEEDLYDVIGRGDGKNWPPLEINRVVTLTDPIEKK